MRRFKPIIFGLLLTLATPGWAQAELKTTGQGKKQRIDPSQFTTQERAHYEVFAQRCTQCHSMNRPISALSTGRTPISGDRFDRRGIKKYVVKMMRKPNSGITRDDAKTIIKFLFAARALAEKAS